MAVAYFQFHWKLGFANNAWLPIVNKGELAVAYCFQFLYIAAHGTASHRSTGHANTARERQDFFADKWGFPTR